MVQVEVLPAPKSYYKLLLRCNNTHARLITERSYEHSTFF